MRERQQRSDETTANAVARGVNILAVRDRSVARHYMEFQGVPEHVIVRVLDQPQLRRASSPEQRVSEAIVPLEPAPDDD
jgi:hypothetical protein